jgi:hypothetical protein
MRFLSHFVFCLLLCFLGPVTGAQICDRALAKVEDSLERNWFTTDRTYQEYDLLTAGMLSEFLLSPTGAQLVRPHWVDMGAGDAVAILQYLGFHPDMDELSPVHINPMAKGTAVGLRLPKYRVELIELLNAKDQDRFRYVHDIMAEQLSSQHLELAELITDIYGPLSYTRDFSQVFSVYQSLMREEAQLIFMLDVGSNSVLLSDGSEISLEAWLWERLKDCGAEQRLSTIEDQRYGTFDVQALRIPKLASHCGLPKLSLKGYTAARLPPTRVWAVDGPGLDAIGISGF